MIPLFKKYKTGLILSGGGARGFAHLGVLKALEEKKIRINIFSGTSAGAIVAAFYADGYTPEEILNIFSSKKVFQLMRITIPRSGLLKTMGLKEVLKKNLRATHIENLKTPVIIAATNFREGKIQYLSQGNLADALLASSSIPILFEVAEIDKIPYIDGSIMDNLPVSPLRQNCRRCIAVHVNPIDRQEKVKNLMQVAERAFHLAISSEINIKKSQVDIFIEPPGLMKYGILDVKKAQEIFNIGYTEAIRILNT